MLQRKKPMNPGKGFARTGWGPSKRDTLAQEVGEGEGSTFGWSKRQQTRSYAFEDEVGEGVVSGFGLSKKTQTRNAGKFQDEVGEGITGMVGRPKSAQRQQYLAERGERVRSIPKLDDPSKFKWGQEVGDGVVAMPKTVAKRNQAVLDSAKGRVCLLQAPYTFHHDPSTTVACHGNGHKFGKGGARKADDHYIVWGCFECHSWLDQGSASAEEKERVFHLGMFRQMLAWEQMAVSEAELPKFRNAAQWALAQLEADEYDPRSELLALA